ncbi:MAG: glutamate--tRNA ligase family protein [Thermodesulfobacteriota bacterium]
MISEFPLRSRFAPTPSGYLHLGNGVNFIITWILVRRAGGILRLRIDDGDGQRCRSEYVDDVFRQLDWLGLDWDEGPQGADEFHRSYSQHHRFDRYRQLLQRLREEGHAYSCDCSRREIRAKVGNSVYPGFCRLKSKTENTNGATRLLVPGGVVVQVEGKEVGLTENMGDFILWRRDNSPSYQLASLADDLDDRISLIVRGEDLLGSTAAQLFMSRCLDEQSFSRSQFFHHGLVTGPAGAKLSKSDRALSLHSMREQGAEPLDVYRAAAPFLAIDPREVTSLEDLLQGSRDTSAPEFILPS